LALTRDFAKLSISPESSDGFASVGTILPNPVAGWPLRFFRVQLSRDCCRKFPEAEANEKKSTSIFTSILKTGAVPPMQEV